MGILSKAKSAVKKVGSAISNTLAPSPSVAAARRQAVFGSTSKTKAGAIIIGTAAAAIAAPIVGKRIASKISGKTAVTKVTTKAVSKGGPIKQAVNKAISKVKPAIGAKVKNVLTQTSMSDTSSEPIGSTRELVTSSKSTKTRTVRGVSGMVKHRKKTLAWYKRQTALLKAKRDYAKARGY